MIYTHKDPEQLKRSLAGEKVYKLESIVLYAFDRELLASLSERLDRRMKIGVTRTDGELYLTVGADSIRGAVTKHLLGAA